MTNTPMPLPDPIEADHLAFFFDFDGTLADIAERPEDVEVTDATRTALTALRHSMQGAVAIITGRDIAAIDQFLTPVQLPVAGVHGLTRRDATGTMHNPDYDGDALKSIQSKLERFVADCALGRGWDEPLTGRQCASGAESSFAAEAPRKRAAIIGSGPSGLAVAGDLATPPTLAR